jgi:hypothetical protein
MLDMTKTLDEPILVRDTVEGRYPRLFTWREQAFEVMEAGGTWRLMGRWWEGEGERRFVRVLTDRGICFDLCWQETTASWHVHKVYD